MKPIHLATLVLAFAVSTSLFAADDKTTKPTKPEPMKTGPMKTEPAAPATGAGSNMPVPAMAKPAPELDATYKALDGTWKCETTFLANAMGPGSPEMKVKTSIKFKKDLNGFWYRGDFEAKKTKEFPGVKGTIYLGHDGKQLLISSVDSMGALASGTGTVSGETLSFVSDLNMMGMRMKTRETIEKKSDKEMVHHYEADMGKGYQPMGHDVCTR